MSTSKWCSVCRTRRLKLIGTRCFHCLWIYVLSWQERVKLSKKRSRSWEKTSACILWEPVYGRSTYKQTLYWMPSDMMMSWGGKWSTGSWRAVRHKIQVLPGGKTIQSNYCTISLVSHKECTCISLILVVKGSI